MAEFIEKTDTLNEGREKLNAAIQDAEDAKNISVEADEKATQALANSESTQTQLDTIVIDGDSSVEAAQARVTEDGKVFNTLRDRLNYTDTQLTQTATDISDRGLNVKSHFNLKGNGTEDITPYLIEALSLSNHVIIPRSSVFYLSGELEIPEGKTIDFNKSLLIFDNENSCINVSPNTVLKNLRVQVNGNAQLNKSVLYFDGNKKFPFGHNTRTNLENIYIEQQFGDAAYENTLIWFDATQKTTDGCYISGVTIKNISSMRGKFGIRNTVKQYSEDSPKPYITGNNIDGYIAYNPVNFIWDDDIVGDGEITGNFYNDVQCQPADNQEKVFLRIVGSRNNFTNVNFWDVSRPSNQENQIIILGGYNYIQGVNVPSYETDYVLNEGRYNAIIGYSVGTPSHYGNVFIGERNIGAIFKGAPRAFSKPVYEFIGNLNCNDQMNTNATKLYEVSLDKTEIRVGRHSIIIKAFGTSVESSISRHWRINVNGNYLLGGNIHDSYAENWVVDAIIRFRRHSDGSLEIKAYLRVDNNGIQEIYIGETNLNNWEEVNFSVHFGSNASGNMTAKSVEAELKTPF